MLRLLALLPLARGFLFHSKASPGVSESPTGFLSAADLGIAEGVKCDGRVALVTGGSRGLGREISLALASRPDEDGETPISHVICVARSLEGCQATASEINQLYPISPRCKMPRSVAYAVDVADGKAVDALLEKVMSDFTRVDILVNNAGVTRDKVMMSMSVKDWQDVINTNLNSVFYFCHATVKKMMQNKWGRIVNMASISGVGGNPGQTNYGASKAAVIGFSKALAKEVAASGVTVNSVAPGFIQSDMTDKLSEPQRKVAVAMIPAGRFGVAHEVASAVNFLAGESASYITGQTLVVDGAAMFGMA